ncbi:hypothetical protein [Burkholderia multivorans]|uniref:hypothetical protein n=1 Tax=Burkholderia multivorans TaxID=87883 RepID=UPI00158D6D3D|nr:hypothetical protein [Burkholderia multivorans]MBU9313216.1 hypothetical protein [Burkholderia multivorans]MBU9347903.1 hypothetical protein [Burkholderia multivorans]MBU9576076.1 hypothetical protein [Burkholderia multivorans]MCA8415067.1 hypothetical protein [Burkholderia multivorans]MDN7965628.1 hypothetical protein [Burkholderia multivorans]
MKRFDLAIDRYQAEELFSSVRSKKDVVVLWMQAIKMFLANQPADENNKIADLSIVVRSMSRLFCELNNGDKIFSVAFPFNTKIVDGRLEFTSREGLLVDSRVSSQILTLIQGNGIFECVDFDDFIDPIFDAVSIDRSLWNLIRELMLVEDAYLRYDNDPGRARGHLHPEHHIDLYYSASGSFKIGLDQQIDKNSLISILSIETDCHYLRPALIPNRRGNQR